MEMKWKGFPNEMKSFPPQFLESNHMDFMSICFFNFVILREWGLQEFFFDCIWCKIKLFLMFENVSMRLLLTSGVWDFVKISVTTLATWSRMITNGVSPTPISQTFDQLKYKLEKCCWIKFGIEYVNTI